MSLNVQPETHTGSQTFLKGSPTCSGENGEVRDLPSCPPWAKGSHLPVEVPNARGESAIVHFLHKRGTHRSNTSLTSVLTEPAMAEVHRSTRVLLTLVFTDIVASTETLERLGDRVWCSLLLRHHDLIREHLRAYGGREIDSAGDGFFLVFDRPSRAVQFAVAVRSALKGIGIDLRVGIHTGECEVSNRRVAGVAVHTAARVANAAAAAEILVSSTVKDVVAGSEHRFIRKDLLVLKGLSEPRQLFAVECLESKA